LVIFDMRTTLILPQDVVDEGSPMNGQASSGRSIAASSGSPT